MEKKLGDIENKIHLEEKEKPKRKLSLKVSKKFLIILGAVFVFLGGVGFFGVLPLFRFKNKTLLFLEEAKKTSLVIKSQDLEETKKQIEKIKSDLNSLESNYQKLWLIKPLPYFKDGERVFRAGRYLIEAGEIALEGIEPYADILGFKKKEEQEGTKPKTTEERLLLALETLDKLQPNMEGINEKLRLANEEVKQIDPQRYPQKIFDKPLREKIIEGQRLIEETQQMVEEIKPLASWLKPLLGFPDQKKYLLLFQNDAELRPTGGFLTAYAILSVDKGNFKPLGSWDIYTLDARFGNRLPPPEPIKKYHKNVYYWHLRDMNLSPDFKVFMEEFWPNYKKAGGVDVDGVIAVDTQVLVDILKVLGPVGVAEWGVFSAENDPRCNCPQVFYELEKMADKPVSTLRTERKAMLGPLMHSILLNVMQSPAKKWPEFFDVAFKNIQEKHILFYFFNEEIQKTIEVLNAGGRIKDYDGDYFHLNDCNFAGAKSNMFIQQTVTQEIEIKENGEIIKTVTVDYRNPAPPSNCNLETGDLCLNGLYRDWVRLYVPGGSELISLEGSEVEPRVYEELGKTVFEAFYGDKAPLRPQGKAQLVFKYKLPFKADKEFKMLIQKQPGTKNHFYEIKLNSHQQNFELEKDVEIEFPL